MSWCVITQDTGDLVCDLDGLSRVSNERHAKDDGGPDGELIVFAWGFVPRAATALREVEELADLIESVDLPAATAGSYADGARDAAQDVVARLRAILSRVPAGG